ncbi:hypothetical protein LCGC14_1918550 [marine sediment metagenome]|uniref:Uncharacterized protein n=1 Tax=marine sediment metagenome TaxID=412755 RepID=A0A0F9IP94_9ZZZZ
MRILEKYRLELHWDTVEYNRDDVAVLKGAYFEGPVLQEAVQLNEEDSLVMDMTNQHMIFMPDYYQATLSWKGVVYKEGRIYFKETHIKGKYVNSIETLKDTDWILMDCKEHEMATHVFNLVYWAEVRNSEQEKKF